MCPLFVCVGEISGRQESLSLPLSHTLLLFTLVVQRSFLQAAASLSVVVTCLPRLSSFSVSSTAVTQPCLYLYLC